MAKKRVSSDQEHEQGKKYVSVSSSRIPHAFSRWNDVFYPCRPPSANCQLQEIKRVTYLDNGENVWFDGMMTNNSSLRLRWIVSLEEEEGSRVDENWGLCWLISYITSSYYRYHTIITLTHFLIVTIIHSSTLKLKHEH